MYRCKFINRFLGDMEIYLGEQLMDILSYKGGLMTP